VPLVAAALAGCGGGEGGAGPVPADGDPAAGAVVFEEAGCGGCHTFGPAGSRGTLGPSLDGLDLDLERVVEQVRDGGGGMPAFDEELDPRELADVAAFVAS